MNEETGINYKIQILKELPPDAVSVDRKTFWDTYNSCPYSYSNKPLCLNDLKAYRLLSKNKDEILRAIKIEVTEMDES